MGGFYGQYLARRFPVRHLFLINPALRPWDFLPDYVGETMTTALGETYTLSAEQINATRSYGVTDPCDGDDDGVPTTLLVDQGDEVIDPRVAEVMYRDCGQLEVFAGGDHAFQHMDEAIGLIRAVLEDRDGR
jgi:hypothetical protein